MIAAPVGKLGCRGHDEPPKAPLLLEKKVESAVSAKSVPIVMICAVPLASWKDAISPGGGGGGGGTTNRVCKLGAVKIN